MLTFKICFKKQPRVSQAKLLKQFYFDIYYGLALERKKKKKLILRILSQKKKARSLSWLIC